MGMDWTHTKKTSVKYHQTGPDMEPPRKEKKRPAEKHLATGPPDRHQEDGPYLEPARDKSARQRTLEVSHQRPISQEG